MPAYYDRATDGLANLTAELLRGPREARQQEMQARQQSNAEQRQSVRDALDYKRMAAQDTRQRMADIENGIVAPEGPDGLLPGGEQGPPTLAQVRGASPEYAIAERGNASRAAALEAAGRRSKRTQLLERPTYVDNQRTGTEYLGLLDLDTGVVSPLSGMDAASLRAPAPIDDQLNTPTTIGQQYPAGAGTTVTAQGTGEYGSTSFPTPNDGLGFTGAAQSLAGSLGEIIAPNATNATQHVRRFFNGGQSAQQPGMTPALPQTMQLPQGKPPVSLSDARSHPSFRGMTDEQIIALATQMGREVTP